MTWNYFDKIYCISLEERPDRRRDADIQFKKVGLSDLVEYLIVKKHPDNPEQGIYESHLICMEKAMAEGADTILIFEDDILFHGFDLKRLEDGIAFMKKQPDWHLFILGCMVRKSRRMPFPSVIKVRYRSLTHAYVIHRRLAEKLKPWHGIPYDDMLRDLNDDHAYALYPSFAFQSNSRSDNERYLPLDRFRRLFGGLRPLQRLDEFYHLRRPLILAVHIAALLLILWFCL